MACATPALGRIGAGKACARATSSLFQTSITGRFSGFFGQSPHDCLVSRYIFDSIRARQVVQEQHRIGALDLAPGALNADAARP
jgi:hypothetical protein